MLFYRNTFVLRKPGESPNDRNDRAIRKIAQFYNEHLKQQSKRKKYFISNIKNHLGDLVSIVLLTDDVANRDLARQDGLIAFSRKLKNFGSNKIRLIVVKEYIATFNRPELLDRLVLKEESFDLEKDIGKRKEVCRKKILEIII